LGDEADHLVMADVFVRRLLLNECERAAGLEPAFFHVRQ
jgi:hypothetical protein